MTLLVSVFTAIIFTIAWYRNTSENLLLHVPCFMFWGASLMWLADAIFEYAEIGAEYFTPLFYTDWITTFFTDGIGAGSG